MVLFIDEYGSRGYVPFETTDLDSASGPCRRTTSCPRAPGTALATPVTQAEYDRLLAAYPVTGTSVVDATAKGQSGYAIVTESASKVVLTRPDTSLKRLPPTLAVGAGAKVSPASGTPLDSRTPAHLHRDGPGLGRAGPGRS